MSRRQDILRRAAELFVERGVARTSIGDIADAVGIKREGVYYYFKSRGDIFVEIILPPSRSLLMNLQRVIPTPMPSAEKLAAAIEIHLDAFNPGFIEMSVALKEDHLARDTLKHRELRRIWRDYNELWVRLVEEGQESGEFDPEVDAKLAAHALLGMCNWVARWYDPSKDDNLSRVIDTFSRIATTGLTGGRALPVPAAAQRA